VSALLRHPLTQLALAASALVLLLTWPLARDLSGQAIDGPYWGSMAWSIQAFAEAFWAGESWSETRAAGFPMVHDVRYLGGVVLVAGLALEPLLGGVRTMNLALLAGPVLSAVCMGLWLRRLLPEGRTASWMLASLGYAFSPHFVANLGNAEVAKAQFWLVPLSLLLAERAGARWRGLLPLAAVALAAAFTEPYGYLVASMALPALALARGRRDQAARWMVSGALWLAAGLLARAWFSPDLPAFEQLFAPARSAHLATDRLDLPFSSAPLADLLWPSSEQAPGGTRHVVYLGWAALAVGAWGLRTRDRLAGLGVVLLALGVLAALGPLLFLTRESPTGLWLPTMALEFLGQPFGTMYYRFLHVGLLGLAVLVARAGLGWKWAVPVGALTLIELGLAQGSLPLRTAPLPWPETAATIASDDQPGAVMTLPAYPSGSAVKDWAFRFAAQHGRPVTDLPKRPSVPTEWPPMASRLDRCFNDARCEVPDETASVLADRGVRVLALRGEAAPELRPGLQRQLGEPTCEDDLCWWWIDARDPAEVPSERARTPHGFRR
jgi:hypothetical protein